MIADRVCQQQGISLWVPFQNAATAVTNLYKGKYDVIMKKITPTAHVVVHLYWPFAFQTSLNLLVCPIRERRGSTTEL